MTRLAVSLDETTGCELKRLGAAPLPPWLNEERAAEVAALEPLSFHDAEFAARRDTARAEMATKDLEAILVFRPSSVEYLCGHFTFEPSPQPLLLTHDDVRLYVPDAELGRALASSTARTIGFFTTGEDALALIAEDVVRTLHRGAKTAVELSDARVPPRTLALLHHGGLAVEDGRQLVERLRLILSPAEVAKMEAAAEATARGTEAGIAAAREGAATDSSVAAAVADALFKQADSSAALPPIVATGRRGGVTHSTWANLPLEQGTTLLEFAGACQRYHAPLMVTLANREPNALERRLEAMAQAALAGVIEKARPGRVAGEVAEEVAERVGELEAGDLFHFNFGYVQGLAHPPTWMDGADWSIVASNREILRAGMAFHMPASFRNFGQAAVGLSHTVILEDGGARILTGHDAQIVCL